MKKEMSLLNLNQMRRIKGGDEPGFAGACSDNCVGCGDASNKRQVRKKM